MSLEMMLRMRARLERCAVSVAADGQISEEWLVVADAVPCLLERVGHEAGALNGARSRCYLPAQENQAFCARDLAGMRFTVEGQTFLVKSAALCAGLRLRFILAELEG